MEYRSPKVGALGEGCLNMGCKNDSLWPGRVSLQWFKFIRYHFS